MMLEMQENLRTSRVQSVFMLCGDVFIWDGRSEHGHVGVSDTCPGARVYIHLGS